MSSVGAVRVAVRVGASNPEPNYLLTDLPGTGFAAECPAYSAAPQPLRGPG
jgi:hypothetical protein